LSSGFSKRGGWLFVLELAVAVLILDIVLVSAGIPIFPRRKAAASATEIGRTRSIEMNIKCDELPDPCG